MLDATALHERGARFASVQQHVWEGEHNPAKCPETA